MPTEMRNDPMRPVIVANASLHQAVRSLRDAGLNQWADQLAKFLPPLAKVIESGEVPASNTPVKSKTTAAPNVEIAQ